MIGGPLVSVYATIDEITMDVSGIEECVCAFVCLEVDVGNIKGSGVDLGGADVSVVNLSSPKGQMRFD